MKKFLISLCPAILLSVLLCGCNSLPDGNPPDGAIVDNTIKSSGSMQKLTLRNALEFFISELINASSIYCYGENIQLEAGNDSISHARYIINNAAKFSGVRLISGTQGRYARVRSAINGKLWSMVLYDKNGKAVWSETVELLGK